MKLKASIGPQIGALSLLLHLESLEQHAIGNRDSTDALRLLGLLSTQVEQLAALTRARVATKDDIQHHAQLLESLSRRMDSIAQSMDQNLRMVEPAATKQQIDDLHSHLLDICLHRRVDADRVAEIDSRISEIDNTTQRSLTLLEAINAKYNDAQASWIAEYPRNSDLALARQDPESIMLLIGLLFAALRRKLVDVSLMIMHLAPGFVRMLWTLTAIARAPTMLLASNIELTDALNRTKSLTSISTGARYCRLG